MAKISQIVFAQPLRGHSAAVNTVAFTPDGKIIISGSSDGSIRFWRIADEKILAISHDLGKGDYITYTPQGYFVASKGGEASAAWRIANKTYPLEQYADGFNRPSLIAEILSGKSTQLPLPSIDLAKLFPPNLVWQNKFGSVNTSNVELVLLYNGSSPFDDIVFIFNGEPLDANLTRMDEEKQNEIRVPLKLVNSENSFQVRVWDKKRLKSEWLKGEFSYSAGMKGIKDVKESASTTTTLGNYGKKYAIIIGISDYLNLPQTSKNKGDLVDLKYTDDDALAFKRFLENANLSGGQWEIHPFINDTATFKNVDEVLTNILSRANARDLIFIFFSGHGRSHPEREKDVYLLTYDFKPEDKRSGYPYSLLRDLISDTRAEHVIAFIDACRSGTIGFSKGDQTQASFSQNIFGERLAQTPANRVIFTSGRGIQLSWEDETFEKSVFTHFLLKGLEGAAPEQKNPQFIDLGELADYVTKQVSEYTKARSNMVQQIPMLWEKSGVMYEDFPVAIRKKQ